MDPAYASDPYIVAYNDIMKKAGLDPSKTTYYTGMIYGWYTVALLKEAASYRGGLNRANIALASHELQVPSPIVIPGIASTVDGNTDASMVEGGQMVKYTVTDPKQLGTWVPDGPVIDTDGQLGTYKTVQQAGG